MKPKMFLSVFMIGLSSSTMIPVKFGFTVDTTQIIATLVPSSLEQCYDACLARKGCLSFDLNRLSRLCRLSSFDRSTADIAQLTRRPGSVYSQKSDWIKVSSQNLNTGNVNQCEYFKNGSSKYHHQACTACSVAETCSIHHSPVTCSISECAKPQVFDAKRMTLGSGLYVGAKMLHKCKLVASLSDISVCGSDGNWSIPELACPTVDIDGKTFKIISSGNNKYWHYDGLVSKDLTSKYQTNDIHAQFTFEKQADGTFEIKSYATSEYMYDGFGVPGAKAWLNANINTSDDNMRYIITMETVNYYRIQTKATGRYIRLDEDQHVSSRLNLKDGSSLFKFEEV